MFNFLLRLIWEPQSVIQRTVLQLTGVNEYRVGHYFTENVIFSSSYMDVYLFGAYIHRGNFVAWTG